MLDKNVDDELIFNGKLTLTSGAKDFRWRLQCVEEVKVGWGVWLWATMGVKRVKGGKRFTCA